MNPTLEELLERLDELIEEFEQYHGVDLSLVLDCLSQGRDELDSLM